MGAGPRDALSRSVVAVSIIAALWLAAEPGSARGAEPVQREARDCSDLRPEQLVTAAVRAQRRLQLDTDFRYLPGGGIAEVRIYPPSAGETLYCAVFDRQSTPANVDFAQRGDTTVLALHVPLIRPLWPLTKNLVLVAFPVESGRINADAPQIAVAQSVTITSGLFSFAIAVVVTALAYLLAALALGRGGRRRFSPIVITAGVKGRASLSKLQILGFTVIVFYLLVFVLLRTGMLFDISRDVLLLLGISAVGAGGGKLAAVSKNRLDFDNWAWVCDKSWLLKCDEDPGAENARWATLLTSGAEFDVYKFQLAVVSVVVAGALLQADLAALASFEIPENLLALLGLSNVVYIGGKAVAPGISELNDKLGAVRRAEVAWRAEAKKAQAVSLSDAKTSRPAEYEDYLAQAREAAVMLRSFFGAGATKFQAGRIPEPELEPDFP